MAAVALLLSLPFIAFIGVWLVRWQDQQGRDRHRKTYKLAFPSDMDSERVAAWVRAISGTLRSGSNMFTGTPTIAFELWATNEGIRHRLKVPWQHADYVVGQLRSLVPGIHITPEDEWPRRLWTRAIEARLTHSERTLRIYNASDVAHSLLAAVQALEAGETVMMQWVVTPAVPAHKPQYRASRTRELNRRNLMHGTMASRDEVADRRDKMEEPNMLAVLRIAAAAETDARADHLLYRVRAALASTRGPSTRFRRRIVPKLKLQYRIDTAAGVVNFPIQLSAPELSALIAWPIGNPFVSGLPPVMSRHLPASELVPREGRVIGRSNFPGGERKIAVDYVSALKHMHIAGPTGVGKTTALANMMKQDMEHGYGVILIENKGDLFQAALDYVPRSRLNDVIVLDVNETSKPVGFNILQQGDSRAVVDELMALFEHLYTATRSVWTREVMYHGLHTLVANDGLAFTDLSALLCPMTKEEADWRDDMIRGVKDPEIRQFWQRFDNQPRSAQDRITQPVLDRIWQLNARPEIRRIIGQSTSSFQMADVIRDNKILLVNLAGLARDTASLTGTLIMNALWHAVRTTRAEKQSFLYLDEFQDFLNLPIDPEDMLAKARGFGLGMVLAHQHLGQLSSNMRDAIMANARTKVIFQTSAEDAGAMTREFGRSVTTEDFMNLGRYEAIARVATGDGVSPPLTLATSEPARGHNIANVARAISRTTYGRALKDIEADMASRRATRPGKGARRPPKVGWG